MSKEFKAKELTCTECGGTFIWTANDQQFYRERGFTEQPKRCKPCREGRRARYEGLAQAGASSPAQAIDGGRQREDFPVTCAKCGTQTTVPFRPVKGRPVFCRPCFKEVRGN